jgi:hypothetical protein
MKSSVGALLLLATLAVLVGCQGVSSGGSSASAASSGSSGSPGSGSSGSGSSGSGSSGSSGGSPSGDIQLIVSPASLGIGNVVDGTSGAASGSLTASGASVTITSAETTNSVFSVSGLSLPVTIAAGQTVPFTVTFSPLSAGSANATLTFASDAQPSTTAQTLSGTGTPAPAHTVNLSWDASSSSNISGYNIYRAIYQSACGSFSRINSTLNTTTLYADSSVTDGTSYCYATTAVNSSSEESGYSNIASPVQIPGP